MQQSERTYSSGYRFGFGGKEKDNEVKGEDDSYDFGARIYDPRLGRWMNTDPQSERYTSYSPYHAMYCNPIAVKDDDGEENIVVVGNQGGTPTSDMNPWYKGGGHRYGGQKRHFLEAGLKAAVSLKEQHRENGEQTTMLVFEGDYTDEELDYYEMEAAKQGVKLIRKTTASEIADYINKSGGAVNNNGHNVPAPNGRGDDLITDFVYVGHGGGSSFLVGYHHNTDVMTGPDLSSNAFSENSNAYLLGCGNGGKIFDYFRDNLVGGNVLGFTTTVEWGEMGIGSFRPFDFVYYPPDNPLRNKVIQPKEKRTRTEKGKAGKTGKVNGKEQKSKSSGGNKKSKSKSSGGGKKSKSKGGRARID